MSKIKYLLISNMYPKNKNDFFGVFIQNIEEGLIQNGVSVDKIVIMGRGNTAYEKIVKYIKFYFSILMTDFDNYDFVQVSYPSHSYLPVIFKRFDKAKLIVRFHGTDLLPTKLIGKLLSFINRRSIRRSDIVVVPSTYFYNEVRKIENPNDHFIYPSGGVDTGRFYPKHKSTDRKFTIGYVGRIDEGKGIDILLDAVSLLDFDFDLIVVGSGTLEKELKKKANRTACRGRINFVGKVPNADLVHYYNTFDVFVFPTYRLAESFGNVAIEAMACKVPVIGSKIPALVEYIFDQVNGYTFTPRDYHDLAGKIERFYFMPTGERSEMAEEAYKVALKYEKYEVTQRFIQKLQSMI